MQLPSTNSSPSRPVRSGTACRVVSHSRGGRCARLITLAFVASERHAAVTHVDLDLRACWQTVLRGLLIFFGRRGAFFAPTGVRRRLGGVACQLTRHDHDSGPEHHRLVMFWTPLIVADQTAVA